MSSITGSKRKRFVPERAYGYGRKKKRVFVANHSNVGVYPRMATAELKTIDTLINAQSVNTASTPNLLNGVATGSDYTDRVGRKVMLKSVQIRGLLNLDPTVTAGIPQLMRMIVVLDRNPNSGAVFSVASLLLATNSYSVLNLDNRDRFRVLADKQYAFGFFNTTATQSLAMGNCAYPIKLYKKLSIPVTYSGTTSAIGSISENALYVLFIGSLGAGTNDGVFTGYARVRFTDQ